MDLHNFFSLLLQVTFAILVSLYVLVLQLMQGRQVGDDGSPQHPLTCS